MDDPKSSLRLMEKRHKPYRRPFNARDVASIHTCSLYDNYEQYVETCAQEGIAVRYSEAQFYSLKARAK